MITADLPKLHVTLGLASVLNTVVALCLWLLVPQMGQFASTFVRSQCVGLSITLISVGIAHAVVRFDRRGAVLRSLPLFLVLILVPAAPLGYALGMTLADGLMGPASGWLSSGPVATGAVLATVLATGAAGYVLWVRQRLAAEARTREEAQRYAAEAELRLLRAQLAPHMLFNTLANLRELIVLDAAAAQAMLDDLIVFLRSTLAASRSERTSLAEEFAHMAAYLRLMGRRMGPRLAWRIELPADLGEARVPPMLLQPLLENAIRHGLEPQPGPGSIEVAAVVEPAALAIRITDTGRGLRGLEPGLAAGGPALPASGTSLAEPPAAGGYGLNHVRQRLQSLYGAAASLTLEAAQPQGVCATVRLPLEQP